MNDRLPHADISIATGLVVIGLAVAASPWLPISWLAITAGLVAAGGLAISLRRPKGVVSGQIPWT